MKNFELEYDFVFNFLSTTDLSKTDPSKTNESVIKEKIELAKSTINDMDNEIIKIKKESRWISKIKNFFIMIFTCGKINKNKENNFKIMEINKKVIKLRKEISNWNSIFKKSPKNENIKKWVNFINNKQKQINEESMDCLNYNLKLPTI